MENSKNGLAMKQNISNILRYAKYYQALSTKLTINKGYGQKGKENCKNNRKDC